MSERNGDWPEGWESVAIGDVVIPKVEQGAASADFTYIDIGSVNNQTKQIDSAKDLIAGSKVPSRAQQHVQAGNILVSMIRPNLNAVAKVPTELDGAICSTGFDVLQPIEVEPDWLFLVVKSRPFVQAMTSLVQGALYPAVRPADVRAYEFALPPLAEQRRIVAKIEALQQRSRRAREALSEVGPLLEQFRQSVLAAAFRGDLTADWRIVNLGVEPASELLHRIRAERRRCWEQAELAKYKAKGQKPPQKWKDNYKEPEPVDDSDLPGLPDGWQWVRLDEVAYSMRSGNAKTSLKAQTNWPILRSSAVRPGLIDFGDVNYMAEDESEESENVLSEGDLMVTRLSGSLEYVGVCAIVHGLNGRRIQYPDRLFRVRLCKSLVAKYIEFCFRYQSLRARLETSAKSSAGHQRISLSDLRSFRFPLPPYDEQELIAETLTQVFASALSIADECSAIAEQADLLDQAILTKAFRGELVPQDPSDESASVLLERIRAQPKRQAKAPKQTSKSHQTSKLGKKSSRLDPQQLTLAEVLRTAD